MRVVQTIVQLIILSLIAASYLSDDLRPYLNDDSYAFLKSNRNQLLGIYYIFLTYDISHKWYHGEL